MKQRTTKLLGTLIALNYSFYGDCGSEKLVDKFNAYMNDAEYQVEYFWDNLAELEKEGYVEYDIHGVGYENNDYVDLGKNDNVDDLMEDAELLELSLTKKIENWNIGEIIDGVIEEDLTQLNKSISVAESIPEEEYKKQNIDKKAFIDELKENGGKLTKNMMDTLGVHSVKDILEFGSTLVPLLLALIGKF